MRLPSTIKQPLWGNYTTGSQNERAAIDITSYLGAFYTSSPFTLTGFDALS